MATLLTCGSLADDFPNRSLRWIVPFPAGGGTDSISRVLAQKLTEAWGRQVVVDNRPGSAGAIGLELAAKANPDGYTLVLSQIANVALAPAFNNKLSYDPQKDLAAVTLVLSAPFVLLAHPSIPARNTRELVALARARPDEILYGSSGSGSFSHITGSMINSMAGVRLVHVPYKGVALATSDLFSGRIGLYVSPIPPAIEWLKGGRVRALGITSARRSKALPEVASIAESLPGFSATNWYGVMVPANTPIQITNKINSELVRIMQLPEVRVRLEQEGGEVNPSTPDQFAAFINTEMVKWAAFIKQSGITIE